MMVCRIRLVHHAERKSTVFYSKEVDNIDQSLRRCGCFKQVLHLHTEHRSIENEPRTDRPYVTFIGTAARKSNACAPYEQEKPERYRA